MLIFVNLVGDIFRGDLADDIFGGSKVTTLWRSLFMCAFKIGRK